MSDPQINITRDSAGFLATAPHAPGIEGRGNSSVQAVLNLEEKMKDLNHVTDMSMDRWRERASELVQPRHIRGEEWVLVFSTSDDPRTEVTGLEGDDRRIKAAGNGIRDFLAKALSEAAEAGRQAALAEVRGSAQ